jgi:hypothetical protein
VGPLLQRSTVGRRLLGLIVDPSGWSEFGYLGYVDYALVVPLRPLMRLRLPQPGLRPERRYPGYMTAKPVMSAEELFERVRHAPPPTGDDVSILWDGRRLDSRQAVLEWLAEVEAKRAEERASADAASS